MVSFAREIESQPSQMSMAFVGASAADHLVTAKHSLTPNIDNNPDFTAEIEASRTSLEMANDGIELRQAELAQVEDEIAGPSVARRAGAEIGGAVASTPVEVALATALDAVAPGAGTVAMMTFKTMQAASIASISAQALSPQAGHEKASSSFFNRDVEEGDIIYESYAEEGGILSTPAQPSVFPAPEAPEPALYWKDPVTSDPVMEGLVRQHEYASGMLHDIAMLQDRELGIRPPQPQVFGVVA